MTAADVLEDGAIASGDPDLRDRVIDELTRFLAAAPEVELAAVYRRLVGRLGAHVVPHIGEAIEALRRSGDLELEPATPAASGPVSASVRRGRAHGHAADRAA